MRGGIFRFPPPLVKALSEKLLAENSFALFSHRGSASGSTTAAVTRRACVDIQALMRKTVEEAHLM